MRFLAARRGIRTGSAFSGGVLPGSEGKGLGKSMLAATLLAMKRRRYPTCYCHTVTEDNKASRGMIESLGGRVVRRFMGFRREI